MKKRTKIIIISIILLIIVGTITFKVLSDFNKEKQLKEEIKEIIKYYEKDLYNDPKLIKILDRQVIKKGQYKNVETSIKNYYKDLTEDLSNLDFLLSEDNYSTYLTEKNIKEDQPTFIKSKDNLDNTQKQIESVYTEIETQLNDQTHIVTYILDEDVKNYYKEFYLSLVNDYLTKEYKESLTNKKDLVLKNINTYQDTFDYLISTKGKWDIESNVIRFKDPIQQEEYNTIINKIKEVK